VATTMFVMFNALPGSTVLSIVATVLVFVFFVTSGDSATLVLGTMSTGGDPDPKAKVKIIWGVLVSGIAMSLLLAGGINALQAATIVFALPFSVVIILMCIALVIAVREDWREEDARERKLHRRLREWVSKEEAAAQAGGSEAAPSSRPAQARRDDIG
jgi:glycine betaine transporter